MTDNEHRFLKEIAGRLPLSRIVEVHLFAPLRQGGMESGVAIVATGPEEISDEQTDAPGTASEDELVDDDPASSDNLQARFAVHTARYRHTQKGVDRGKWEFEMAIEADAPLLAIDRVVSGVLQRSGEQGEPVRLSGADIRASIGDADWIAKN